MSINITLKHLRGLVALAEEGSYTRASQRLFITQSSLTATIKHLEEALGLILFDRTTRRVSLTREGSEFLPVVQRLLHDFTAAIRDIKSLSARQKGHVTIAAASSMVALILPRIISDFNAQFPDVTAVVGDGSARSVQQRVADSEVDFGITTKWAEDKRLDFCPLLRDRLHIVTNRAHPLARNERITWNQLEGYPLIGIEQTRSQVVTKIVLDLIGHHKEPTYQLSSAVAVGSLLCQGKAVCALPALAAHMVCSSRLTLIELYKPTVDREICIITRRGRALSPAAQALLQLIQSTVKIIQLPAGVQLIRSSRSPRGKERNLSDSLDY